MSNVLYDQGRALLAQGALEQAAEAVSKSADNKRARGVLDRLGDPDEQG